MAGNHQFPHPSLAQPGPSVTWPLLPQVYQELFRSLDQGYCIAELIYNDLGAVIDFVIVDSNESFRRISGFTEPNGRRRQEFQPLADRDWLEALGRVARDGGQARFERYSPSWGKWSKVLILKIGDARRSLVAFTIEDITEDKRRAAHADLLIRLSQKLATLKDEEALVRSAVTLLGEFLDADRCYLVERSAREDEVRVSHNWRRPGTTSLEGTQQLNDFGGQEWWERCAAGNYRVRDTQTDPLARQPSGAVGAAGLRSYAVQPFRQRGETTVLLVATEAKAREWSNAELTLLEDVVTRVWPALEALRAGRKIRENEAFLSNIVGATADCVEVLELDGQLAWISGTIKRVLEVRDVRALQKRSWLEFWDVGSGRDEARSALREAGQGRVAQFQGSCPTMAGPSRWWDVVVSPISGADGKPARVLAVSREATASHQAQQHLATTVAELTEARDKAEKAGQVSAAAEQQFRAINEAKDAFLAALSHELRTPLAPILLTGSAMLEDPRLPEEFREQVETIQRNAALEARLIDDLLDLTRISHGKLELRAEDCGAHQLIGLAIDIVREDAAAKNIAVVRCFNATNDALHADAARFQQVIWNLLRNAVKFTPAGGTITVRTENQSSKEGAVGFRAVVSDTGIGIPAERLESIFQPFDQGAVDGVHRFGGLGLGLAIARAVVELHQAKIYATSAGVGKGADFTVEFQSVLGRRGSAPISGLPSSASQGSNSISPLRILLVEDHVSTLATLRLLLERDGHRVEGAATVGDALALAGSRRFDLVISDLGLPDASGNELMEMLRSKHGLSGIALSGYGMEEDLASSKEAGFFAHLVKPVQIASLRKLIQAHAERVT